MEVVESIGRASYDGLTASWKYRSDRFQFVAHYTYSKAYSSDVNATFFWEPRNTDQARPEEAYGLAELDMRHQLTGHAIIAVPAGISWSAILRSASAPPLNPVAGTDLNGDQFTNDRALQAPGHYFGRNSFRNRAMHNLDVRVLKEFGVSDRLRVELSAEPFNCLDLDNVEYGKFSSVYGPGVSLETGTAIGPAASFRRLRNDDGSYDRNNTQVPGVGPLQAQIGL